jgi:hypothetical protein
VNGDRVLHLGELLNSGLKPGGKIEAEPLAQTKARLAARQAKPGLIARLFRQPKPPGPQDAAPPPNFGPGPAPRTPAPKGLFRRLFRLP